MFTRALRHARTPRLRRLAPLAVSVALIAAPLALLPVAAEAAATSSLTSSPFNGTDGTLDNNASIGAHDDVGTPDTFAGGVKEDTDCPPMDGGGAPDKSDILTGWVGNANGVVSGVNHAFLYLAWSRPSDEGTATIDFELNSGSQSCGSGSSFVKRVAGTDLLITYDFQGGNTIGVSVRVWTSTPQGGEWGAPTTIPATKAEASISGNQLFGEAVIDMTAAGFFEVGVCKGFSSAIVKSRSSSSSFENQVKDLILPFPVQVTNCGSLTVSKTVIGGTANDSFDFTFDCGDLEDSFSLGDGGSHLVDDIPLGSTCTVSESAPDPTRWSTTYQVGTGNPQAGLSATGIVIALGNKAVAFTNTRRTGVLVITKTADAQGTFLFNIDCTENSFDRTGVSAAPGQPYRLESIPTGTTCTVTEQSNSLFSSVVIPADGSVTIATGDNLVAFTNTRLVGTLRITKAADAPGTFTFDIDCTGNVFDRTGISASPDSPYALVGIPTGTTCTVTEQSNSLFSSVADPADGVRVIATGTNTVAFTNTAKPNGISIDKQVNGQDTSAEDPLDVEVGSTLTYVVMVTNSGQVPLSISELTDTLKSDVGAPCVPSVEASLDPGESVTCTYTMTAADAGGSSIIHNTAAATGTDVFNRTAGPVHDETWVHVLNPVIHLDKAGPASAHVGDTIAYTLTVTNPGNTPLAITGWADDVCDAAPVLKTKQGDDDLIDPGEAWAFTCSHVVAGGDPDRLVNTATVTGMDPLEAEVDSTDDAATTILRPAIAISKSGTTSAHVGEPVVYTLRVTNPGNTPLSAVTVTDPKCDETPVRVNADADGLLSPGEAWTYQCAHVITAADGSSILNTARAEGTDPLGQTVNSSADHRAAVFHPAISIVKTANPESVSVSGPVTYTYVVTNTGDVLLQGVLVTDDILGAIGSVGRLGPGESITMAKTVVVDAATPPRNIGTVVGTDPLGQTVTAADDAVITVVLGVVLAQPELPRTGAPLGAQTRAALALIQVGIVLTLAGRRRRVSDR